MSRSEMAEFTNLCMVSDGNGNILVQDRKNPDWPGVTFPGGHVEPEEPFTDSVIREVREETGLTIENPVLCGAKQFQSDEGARYVVFLYRADRWHGELESSSEGEMFWIPRQKLSEYLTVPDFEDLVRVFESPDLSEFYYTKENGGWKMKLF